MFLFKEQRAGGRPQGHVKKKEVKWEMNARESQQHPENTREETSRYKSYDPQGYVERTRRKKKALKTYPKKYALSPETNTDCMLSVMRALFYGIDTTNCTAPSVSAPTQSLLRHDESSPHGT